MNLLTKSYNSILSIYNYIFFDKYTYSNIILYIIKSSLHAYKLVHKHIIMFELCSFNYRV